MTDKEFYDMVKDAEGTTYGSVNHANVEKLVAVAKQTRKDLQQAKLEMFKASAQFGNAVLDYTKLLKKMRATLNFAKANNDFYANAAAAEALRRLDDMVPKEFK